MQVLEIFKPFRSSSLLPPSWKLNLKRLLTNTNNKHEKFFIQIQRALKLILSYSESAI